jgi:flavin-binding protein dodecin
MVVRTLEVDGASPKDWNAAVDDAIATAKKKEGTEAVAFEVVRLSGEVAARRVRRYRVTLKIAYGEPLVGP